MNKTIIILTIILASLLTSCSGGTSPTGGEGQFIGGTTGLTIAFEPQQPPTEVYDDGQQAFSVMVRLENKGEFDVTKDKAVITLSGFRAELFNKVTAQLQQPSSGDLIGVKRLPTGEVQQPIPIPTEFADLNHKGKVTGLQQEYPIKASVCYQYKNTAASQVCVRKSIITPKADGLCEISGEKPVQNSGGPIQITSLTTMSRGQNSVGFTFSIDHKGTGTVHKITSSCSTERTNEGKIMVKVDTGLTGTTCTGLSDGSTQGTIYQGTAKYLGTPVQITCTQPIDRLDDYVQPVKITTEYDYQESTSTNLIVKTSAS